MLKIICCFVLLIFIANTSAAVYDDKGMSFIMVASESEQGYVTIYLDDGSVLTGNIVASDENKIKIETISDGQIIVYKNNIKEIKQEKHGEKLPLSNNQVYQLNSSGKGGFSKLTISFVDLGLFFTVLDGAPPWFGEGVHIGCFITRYTEWEIYLGSFERGLAFEGEISRVYVFSGKFSLNFPISQSPVIPYAMLGLGSANSEGLYMIGGGLRLRKLSGENFMYRIEYSYNKSTKLGRGRECRHSVSFGFSVLFKINQ